MARKLTITVSDEVYEGLYRVVGRRRIGRFLERLARPHLFHRELDAAYERMARDELRESKALAWSEGLIADVEDDPR